MQCINNCKASAKIVVNNNTGKNFPVCIKCAKKLIKSKEYKLSKEATNFYSQNYPGIWFNFINFKDLII